MTEKPDVWIPIYIGDYLGDTGHLVAEQHGAYLLLIFAYWRSGPLRDDDRELAQTAALDSRGWRRNRATLQRFFRIEDGLWRHKRIDAELEGWAKRKEKAVERAEKAARKRWGDATSNAPSMPQALLEQCPSSSPLEEEGFDKPSSLQRRESARASQEARASRVPVVKPIPEPDQPTAKIVAFPSASAK